MRPADRAWVALGVGIAAFDLLSKEEEQLSSGVDRYLECRPWLTRAVVMAIALHLLNLLPVWVDPFRLVLTARRKTLRRTTCRNLRRNQEELNVFN